jgi:hypothetical protein
MPYRLPKLRVLIKEIHPNFYWYQVQSTRKVYGTGTVDDFKKFQYCAATKTFSNGTLEFYNVTKIITEGMA